MLRRPKCRVRHNQAPQVLIQIDFEGFGSGRHWLGFLRARILPRAARERGNEPRLERESEQSGVIAACRANMVTPQGLV